MNQFSGSKLNHPAPLMYIVAERTVDQWRAPLAKHLASVPRATGARPGRQPRKEHGHRRLPRLHRWRRQAGAVAAGRRADDTAHACSGGDDDGGENQSHHETKRPAPRRDHRRRSATRAGRR
ncbi:hypothetical protein SETIT_2G273800v2 [Setaria italica]|uniref:Uncharacterized protein n=1 Tax=Setaria italica TaxID=4555 RepID=A0A368Q3P7_SETIT|nr:hypothetical protein SETIT_2G273800v2 [Setaria italica]